MRVGETAEPTWSAGRRLMKRRATGLGRGPTRVTERTPVHVARESGLSHIAYGSDVHREPLLKLPKHPVAPEHLGDTSVRLPTFGNSGDKLAVLQLDAVQ